MMIQDGTSANAATALRLGAKGRAVFTQAGWNAALRDAGIAAGNWWIANYLPMRFNKAYAVGQLQYTQGGRDPFFDRGVLRSTAFSRAKTNAVATKGRARFWVSVPFGHPVRPAAGEAFKRIPPRESKSVAREFRRAVIQAIMRGRTEKASKIAARAAAKAERKAARAAAAATRRASAKASRAQARATAKAERLAARRRVSDSRRAMRARTRILFAA